MTNRWNLPDLGTGLGLRGCHVRQVLAERPPVGFFELLSENYMGTLGRPLATAEAVADAYPVVLHGVSLSIGSADPLDRAYLRELRDLAERTRARWVSDHLCWTGVDGRSTHDLLPLPYDEATLAWVGDRVRAVADFLGRPVVLENPSSYFVAASSPMSEPEFLARLCEDADCALLLDVNNVYVSSRNHGLDPQAYLDAIPVDRVVQVHLAGHSDLGTHLLDTHSDFVSEAVWDLYARFLARAGAVSTLLEWDADIPAFEVLWAEARKADAYRLVDAAHDRTEVDYAAAV
jgi:uncharacterized protein (UPF0276 family)